ncbi:VIT1/CCC1 transporter family protein [Candidatus Peregrinibacteria bacterium]|nr:VIT1/CCC1 transporter family protein [Candidatus Peregrinibacteria bacterium]
MHKLEKPDFQHRSKVRIASTMKEIVFGMEDGMVSTLGAITGIATGSQDHSIVLLSGFVIIAVESISMGIGSYLSNKSEIDISMRTIHEEQYEIDYFLDEEREELVEMYTGDGWPPKLAKQMAEVASQNRDLILKEMAYRELQIIPESLENPWKKGFFMSGAYVLGGAVPLLPYVFSTKLSFALSLSILLTLIGLFLLGVYTTKYSKRNWLRAGMEMLIFATLAALIGYAVGAAVNAYQS